MQDKPLPPAAARCMTQVGHLAFLLVSPALKRALGSFL